jgi:hypothetical protein
VPGAVLPGLEQPFGRDSLYQLRMWIAGQSLHCQVTDGGPATSGGDISGAGERGQPGPRINS